MRKRRSFFERITGTVNLDERGYNEVDLDIERTSIEDDGGDTQTGWLQQTGDSSSGELAIDMYELDNQIVIQAMIAGVKAGNLDIDVGREMVTIEGHRDGPHGVPQNDWYHNELYWGSFSRTIVLPEEVEVEQAQAVEEHGLLIIRLPKLDKARSTKLRVKSRS